MKRPFEHAFQRYLAMKRPFCRPGPLRECMTAIPCHYLMPDPFMRDIQKGTWRGIHAESEIIPTGSSPGEIKGDSD